MRLRDSTVAGLCLFLMGLAWLVPLPVYDAPEFEGIDYAGINYEGIDNDLVNWSCGIPITNLAPPPVDLDEVRADLAALEDPDRERPSGLTAGEQEKVESRHPQCAGLARTQLVLGLLCAAAGIWRGRRWWVDGADYRAERKFKRLHEGASGRPPSKLL